MNNARSVTSLIVAAACCALIAPVDAATIQTLGTGSAVTTIDRFDNFDSLDYAHNGTPLSDYPQPPQVSTGLSVRTNGNSFYGDDFYGSIQPTLVYFNPFHLTGANPVGVSYFPAGGGFYFPYDGDFGNTDWVTIDTTDAKKIYGVEFLYGNGWTTDATSGPFPWGSDTAIVEWQTLSGGTLVSSGTVASISVGSVLGFSDPAGFDQLLVRCPHPNSIDPTLQELALDNLVVQLSPISEPCTPTLLSAGAIVLFVYQWQRGRK